MKHLNAIMWIGILFASGILAFCSAGMILLFTGSLNAETSVVLLFALAFAFTIAVMIINEVRNDYIEAVNEQVGHEQSCNAEMHADKENFTYDEKTKQFKPNY